MPRKGHFWNYFNIVDDVAKKAECIYCKKSLSYKTTISNLKNHLKQKHVIVYEDMCNIARSTNNNDAACSAEAGADAAGTEACQNSSGGGAGCGIVGSADGGDGGDCTTVPVLHHAVPRTAGVVTLGIKRSNDNNTLQSQKRQRVMSSYLSRPLSMQEKSRLDKLLVNMVAVDCQPFSIVTDEGFKSFVHGLNPNYELPGRKTLSSTLLSREYEECLSKIKAVVNAECLSMCLTVDCWTSRTMQPYIAITGHFIKKTTLEFKSILLQCTPLDGSHTGENIAQAIASAVQEWNLVGKINFFVTDNASNMECAAIILQYPHFGCYAHKLNLIAQHSLACPEVASTIAKIQKTVAHFKRSSLAKEKLLKYQINAQGVAEGSALTLIISVPTRWNSTFLMLQRFLQLQEALRATVPNLNVDLPIIPLEEWRCLEQYCAVLKPLYEATLIMSADNYLTASKAIVITQGLTTLYEKMADSNEYFPPVKKLLQNITIGLNRRFHDLEKNMCIAVCTFLDPRFKQYAFDEETLRNTKGFIIDMICKDFGLEATHEDPCASSLPVSAAAAASTSSLFSLWNVIDKKISASQQPRSAYDKVQDEVDMYLKQAVIARDDSVVEWWKGHSMIYPSLYKIFIKKCNIVVTSVPCERAFSKAGNIIDDRRTRLTSSKVTKLMFLHGNKNF